MIDTRLYGNDSEFWTSNDESTESFVDEPAEQNQFDNDIKREVDFSSLSNDSVKIMQPYDNNNSSDYNLRFNVLYNRKTYNENQIDYRDTEALIKNGTNNDIRDATNYEKYNSEKEKEQDAYYNDIIKSCNNDGIVPDEGLVKEKKVKPGRIRKKWVIEDETDVCNFNEIVPNLAISFPFELDEFQKRAIIHLEKRQHVFVAAHTSAGKTVVAEYAMALALNRGKKAVYTSPIKALSNQKYREFKQKFPSVGIVTGDVSVNPDASCLIVTTEILRSLIYRYDPLIASLDVVIFDEVHYVNDPERGVVWEEVIVLVPNNVNLVMLSATVPNYKDFADWIGFTKEREVFAILTQFRPTPLKHFLYISDKAFLLMDCTCTFNTNAYSEMNKYIKDKMKTVTLSSKSHNRGNKSSATQQLLKKSIKGKEQTAYAKQKTDIQRLQGLIKKLEQDNELPVVAFCFSRKRCELYANSMPKLDVAIAQDKSKIHIFIKDSLSTLSDSDNNLPQVRNVVSLLQRGIGIHHGGLLPILKELVEILFSRGLVRVLFATETFAMGVNMPARSVVFTSLRKHDGQKFRILLASEYTQMAGRAGRRGIDKFGNVYIFCPEEPPDQTELINMMIKKATPLRSKFRLAYKMLLQLSYRSSASFRIEDMMAKSFMEYIRAKELPTMRRDMLRRQKELQQIPDVKCILGEPTIKDFVDLQRKYTGLSNQLHYELWNWKPDIVFNVGRIVAIHSIPGIRSSCGAVLLKTNVKLNLPPTFTCLVLLPPGIYWSHENMESQVSETKGHFKITYQGTIQGLQHHIPDVQINELSTQYRIYRDVPLDNIMILYNKVISHRTVNLDLLDTVEINALAEELRRLLEANGNTSKLEPFIFTTRFKKIEIKYYETILKQRDIHEKWINNKCFRCFKKEEHYNIVCRKEKCLKDIEDFSHNLADESLGLYDEMKCKLNVLRKLNYIQPDGSLSLKGQVSCEILANDELSLTEVIFEHLLNDLDAPEIAAILSAYVFPEKSEARIPDVPPEIEETRNKIINIHRDILFLQKSFNVHVDAEEYWRMCNFQLSQVAYNWAKGKSFLEIMEDTPFQEGSIVRALLRLFELCKRISEAAVRIGNNTLATKMEATCNIIRRDIVFAVSLYLQ